MNYGINKSVYQKILNENPHAVAAHCNDHILHNCAKHALKMMSFDTENLINKIFAEFSTSSKKTVQLKECFDFFESEYKNIFKNVPTRWLSLFQALERILRNWEALKKYFIEDVGLENCSPVIKDIIGDQKRELAPQNKPTGKELYLYFVHNFMASFQNIILILQKENFTIVSLHKTMLEFRNSLQKRLRDQFYGMTVHQALKKKYICSDLTEKFIREANLTYQRAIDYLNKWFPFDNKFYQAIDCLDFTADKTPSLDQILELWSYLPSSKNTNDIPPDELYEEINKLEHWVQKYPQSSSSDDVSSKWKLFFKDNQAPNLLKILQYVLSIPVSNAGVERIFSVMGFIWTDERNRLSVESVRSELCICFNIPFSCTELKEKVKDNKKLLRAVSSNQKYIKKID